MRKDTLRPVWTEIDLSCIDHNIKSIRKKVGNVDIIGVVKADAYGHGAVEVSRVLLDNGVSTLAVATLGEAISLRGAGFTCPIVLLGLIPELYFEHLIRHEITPVISSHVDARELSSLALQSKTTTEVYLAVETGMGRIGFLPEASSITEIQDILRLPGIRIKGLFSHFATADHSDKLYAQQQIDTFLRFRDALRDGGISVDFLTLANSAALMELPAANFDAVRPGIILYGCYPSSQVHPEILDLQPALSLKANIVHLKKVSPGFSVSYGRTFITQRESIIATLPLGYADGYPRFLSGKGRVLVRGQFAPVVGTICMDQCMIDVTDIPGVCRHDEVVLIGSQGKNTILADELAEKTGTINYEILCRISPRVPRIHHW